MTDKFKRAIIFSAWAIAGFYHIDPAMGLVMIILGALLQTWMVQGDDEK